MANTNILFLFETLVLNALHTSHYGKEGPWEVPEGWIWCGFPVVARLISGQDFPPERYNSEANGIPYIIGASNIEYGHLVITRWTDSPSVLSDIGDILVVCKGAGVGKIGINSIGTVHIARQIQAVRIVVEVVLPEYMQMLINWCVPSIVSHANGLIPGLKRELLLGVQLPIPPINEQKRILRLLQSVFTTLDEIEDHQKKLTKGADSTKKIILDLAIHGKLVPQDPSDESAIELLKRINPYFVPSDNLHYEGSIPSGWQIVRMGDVIDIVSGTSYQKTDIVSAGTGIRVLRGGNIQDGNILICEDDVFINSSLANKGNTIGRGDTVIVASTGSSELIGKAAFATKDYPETQIGAFLRIIRPKSICISEYLGLIFQTEYYKHHIKQVAKGTNINNIKSSYITEFAIPLPPLEEQRRIQCQLKRLLSIIDQITDFINGSE